jgi:hypothetical protein
MDIDATDMRFIMSLIETLDIFADQNGGYHVDSAEVWYEGDFLGRLHFNVNKDGKYTFRAAGAEG